MRGQGRAVRGSGTRESSAKRREKGRSLTTSATEREASAARDDNDLKALWRHVKESARLAALWKAGQDLRPARKPVADAVAENLRAAATMLEDLF